MHKPDHDTTDTDLLEERLLARGVKPTAMRLWVFRELEGAHHPLSLRELEERMVTAERSTIFRTLTLLSEAHLLHDTDDGSGSQKYCVCHLDDTRQCYGHVHLTCRQCHRTFCLKDVHIPSVPLPAGFQIEEAEYVVKGICPQCNNKGTRIRTNN